MRPLTDLKKRGEKKLKVLNRDLNKKFWEELITFVTTRKAWKTKTDIPTHRQQSDLITFLSYFSK
jgi:hypothetical protein